MINSLLAGMLAATAPYPACLPTVPLFVNIDCCYAQAAKPWRTEAIKALDIRITKADRNGISGVVVTADRTRLMALLPVLQQHAEISPSITKQDLAKRPAFYVNALSLRLVSWAVTDLYATDPDLGASRWTTLLSSADESGAVTTQEIFSFTFDRSLYNALDWDKLSFAAFPTQARAFSYNLRFTWQMAREMSGGIDED